MKIIKAKDYDDMSKIAAQIIGAQITLKPDCVLGLATGSTPIGTYSMLADWCSKGYLDFASVTTFNLDEYLGLDPQHDQSYRHYMNSNLFNKINIKIENTNVPNGKAVDVDKECMAYENKIEGLDGITLQLLGIGNNGHIGFNEPDDSFSKSTHCVRLADNTIEANARFFDSIDMVPKKAITMGIGTIMKAKKAILIANGEGKREILKKSLFGPITPRVPASILQLHPDLTVITDNSL